MGTLARTAGIAALAVLALVAAGCGGSPKGSAVANIGTASTTATTPSSAPTPTTAQARQAAAYAFSKCMRANGVPSFPDPSTSGGGIRITPGSGLNPDSPQFKKAQQQCQKLLPNGGRPSQQQIQKLEQQALAFSKCMRSHGVPKFPDPQFSTSGGFGIRIHLGGPGSGLDPNAPAFQRAQQACSKLMPGLKGGPKPGSGSSSTSQAKP